MTAKSILALLALALVFATTFSGNRTGRAQTDRNRLILTDTLIKPDSAINWEKMTRPERKEYMRKVVLPKMKPILHEFDPKLFKDVKCVTCHGNGALNGAFKMPNPKLAKLPASPEGFAKLRAKKPAIMKFMSETMKPTMAELLGMKPFDPKTGTGFGCGNCHMSKKK